LNCQTFNRTIISLKSIQVISKGGRYKCIGKQTNEVIMELHVVGSNQTEVHNGNVKVFFSYDTPVAYYDSDTETAYVTTQKYSKTTSKHVNLWLKYNEPKSIVEVSQIVVDAAFKILS
jgi:hypothetical protein